MPVEPRVAVVGSGSWGSALAGVVAGKGVQTILWARRPELAEAIATRHENPDYLPGSPLPDSLTATDDLDERPFTCGHRRPSAATGHLDCCARTTESRH